MALISIYVSKAERYEQELDAISLILQRFHPIGKTKKIGRLECAELIEQILKEKSEYQHSSL